MKINKNKIESWIKKHGIAFAIAKFWQEIERGAICTGIVENDNNGYKITFKNGLVFLPSN